ncbi:MAG: universal stress protein [Bacillota bacterium]
MKKILLAVDGSESAKKAAKEASYLFGGFRELEVTILTVLKNLDNNSIYDIPVSMYASMSVETLQEMSDQKREEYREIGYKIVSEAAEFFKDIDVSIKDVVKIGDDPADVICDFAENNDIDLIVIADRGLGKVERFLLGSISDKVVRHAQTSVLLVK